MLTKAQIERDAIEARKLAQYVAKVQRLLGHLVYDRHPTRLINEAYATGKSADAYAAEIASQEPVGKAVHALKADAVKSAAQRATATIERVKIALAEGEWDIAKVAPYPRDIWSHEAQAARANNNLFHSLTTEDSSFTRTWHDKAPKNQEARIAYFRNRKPEIVTMSEDGCARFIAQAETTAAFEYDAFICKLVAKVGDCDSAELQGSHIWDHSILTVTKDDVTERWSTKQIWNVSKLGLHFPQWPTRLMKG